MSKIRVHELAKELNKSSKDVIYALKGHGVDVESHMSTISSENADKIRKFFTQPAAKPAQKQESKPAQDNRNAAPRRSSGSALRCAMSARRTPGRCTARIPDTGTSTHIRQHGRRCGCSGPVFRNNPGDTVRRSPGRQRYRPAMSAACRSPRRDSHNILA